MFRRSVLGRRPAKSVRTASFHLRLERLESRDMLSGVGAAQTTDLTVMSQNLYIGTDLGPLITAVSSGKAAQIISAVTQGWKNVQATNFSARAEIIAREIATARPALVGLQEVALYRTGIADSIVGNPTKASHVELDFLNILLDKLARQGARYVPVAITAEADVEMPGFTSPGKLQDIRLTDRDVILRRADRSAPAMTLSNIQTQHYATNVTFSYGTQTVSIFRGWNSVDVQAGGSQFRFINTHLETDNEQVQYAQAQELLAGPVKGPASVILVGDFNARAPSSATYQLLAGAGLKDAWIKTHPGDPGYTWGNEPDLRNPVPLSLDPQRIDLVLYRGGVTALSMDRVGIQPSDRTRSGLWPSDHAGVVATLGVSLGTAQRKAAASPLLAAWSLGSQSHT